MHLPTILLSTFALLTSAASGTATPGCVSFRQNLAGTSTSGTITSGGLRRSFQISFPKNYNSAPMRSGNPLVLVFHGSNVNPAYARTETQMSNPLLNPDHVVVYPLGVEEHWQGSPYASKSIDDIGFVNSLLTYLGNNYCLNAQRYYASGHSNGGGFCNTIACWPGLSGRFAAFAPVSAAVYVGSRGPGDVCKPDHAVTPMLELHGQSDPVIPWNGGTVANGMSQVPPVLYWMRNWVWRNGCDPDDFVSNVPFPGRVTRWDSGECKVRHFAFRNMPHDWPTNGTNNNVVSTGQFRTPMEGTLTVLAWFRENVG